MERSEMIASAETLLGTMGNLTSLLADEVQNLYARNAKELEEVLAEKNNLLADYANGINTLKNAADGKSLDLPAELSSKMRMSAATLATAMNKNMQALAVAEEASRGVVGAIIEEVKRQRAGASAYTVDTKGEMTTPPPAQGAQAVTFNERL